MWSLLHTFEFLFQTIDDLLQILGILLQIIRIQEIFNSDYESNKRD